VDGFDVLGNIVLINSVTDFFRESRFIKKFNNIHPHKIYTLYWISVITDLVSTFIALQMDSQYILVETNLLFRFFGFYQFVLFYIIMNVSLFLITYHHQIRWGRGAYLLFISVLIHGLFGVNNLLQIIKT
jgi:hypothetical protein